VSVGRARLPILLAVGGIAVVACSKGSLVMDAGAGTGGRAGTGGAAAEAGAGGTSGEAGAGGIGGFAGTGGPAQCTAADERTTCTPDAGPPPSPPFAESPCTVEGARCEGFACHDDFGGSAWVSTCCAGGWRPNYGGSCPPPVGPGDPFPCGSAGLTCATGQTYCSVANPDRSRDPVTSCQPICAAGDCTCFCGQAEGCNFRPAGSTCPADFCLCSTARTAAGIPLPGTVKVQCNYVFESTAGCNWDPSLDGQCPAGQKARFCIAPPFVLDGCTQLPDSVVTASCGPAEIHYYCCSS
jgi:hypothetical protein